MTENDLYASDSRGQERGVIHLIGNLECGFVKIGYSETAADRVRDIQTARPFPLKLLATIPGTRNLERKIQRRFADSRTPGGWFPVDERKKQLLMDTFGISNS